MFVACGLSYIRDWSEICRGSDANYWMLSVRISTFALMTEWKYFVTLATYRITVPHPVSTTTVPLNMQVWGSHSSVAEDSSVVGCGSVGRYYDPLEHSDVLSQQQNVQSWKTGTYYLKRLK
jgi:hypothetical protein